jgi:uracil-DNA glycosylase
MSKNTHICNRCENNSLTFKSPHYSPEEYFEGNPKAKVWIIGLNPKLDDDKKKHTDQKKKDLRKYFKNNGKTIHSYFKNFKKVSEQLFDMIGKDEAAHTDIVKCATNSFNVRDAVIKNCQPYLIGQLKKYQPDLIICNGAAVCETIKSIVKPKKELNGLETSYVGSIDNYKVRVVLSGFIGRIDNYARRRLGKEIEQYLNK